jgi:hypothetical protein
MYSKNFVMALGNKNTLPIVIQLAEYNFAIYFL